MTDENDTESTRPDTGARGLDLDAIEALGFPRVADLLEAGDVHCAWRELRRFKTAAVGDAQDLARARAAMPEDVAS